MPRLGWRGMERSKDRELGHGGGGGCGERGDAEKLKGNA